MKTKKIYILLGHPDKETYSGVLTDEYERAAREAGHEVRRHNIGELHFDPILHKGYKVIQELEPDLVSVQENFKWANHIVIVYPNWWITMPAILKGLFDRMFLPGFAFQFDKQTKKLRKLLTERSARVINISGTHAPWKTRFAYGDYTNELARGILEFAGMQPVRISGFGPSERCSDAKREKWKKQVYRLGKRGI